MTVSKLLLTLFALLLDVPDDNSFDQEGRVAVSAEEEFPLLMKTSEPTLVRQGMLRRSAPSARIYRGAVVRVAARGSYRGCKRGWVERLGGGYICRKNLKPTEELEARPTPLDLPDLIDGFDAYKVAKSGPKLYRSLKAIRLRDPYVRLRRGSVLVVQDQLVKRGISYFKTRQGWYVEAKRLEKLPPRIDTLAVDIKPGELEPLGVAIKETEIYASPTIESDTVGKLDRWAVIPKVAGFDHQVDDGWVQLGENRYVLDKHVALNRPPSLPANIEEDERIIAVDVGEQMLHAYEGSRLVRMVPCSTGKRGNTKPGKYRVQWKRRAQTMRLRMGSVRVEDVQWVMYYNRKSGIAIHSAYWHSDFGTPVSHGCVNLPIQDARWLFEWSTPGVIPEDSERFPVPGDPGSRVLVYR